LYYQRIVGIHHIVADRSIIFSLKFIIGGGIRNFWLGNGHGVLCLGGQQVRA
tara:strand:+ start:230 stop:385 length:156 start_codon:yes stop_codon:yes gene_type:complete